MLKCGLLGEKLSHSYSPEIHKKLGEYEYKLYEKTPEELEEFILKKDYDGLNVTIPYKQVVMPYLDELSKEAKRIGSVNTIVKRADGTLFGDNTDIYGFAIFRYFQHDKINRICVAKAYIENPTLMFLNIDEAK